MAPGVNFVSATSVLEFWLKAFRAKTQMVRESLSRKEVTEVGELSHRRNGLRKQVTAKEGPLALEGLGERDPWERWGLGKARIVSREPLKTGVVELKERRGKACF